MRSTSNLGTATITKQQLDDTIPQQTSVHSTSCRDTSIYLCIVSASNNHNEPARYALECFFFPTNSPATLQSGMDSCLHFCWQCRIVPLLVPGRSCRLCYICGEQSSHFSKGSARWMVKIGIACYQRHATLLLARLHFEHLEDIYLDAPSAPDAALFLATSVDWSMLSLP